MLQRIQSIALGLVVVLMIAFLKVPLWEKVSIDHVIDFTMTSYSLVSSTGLEVLFPYIWSFLLACAVILLAICTIVRHDNRSLQLNLIMVMICILTGLIMLIRLLISKAEDLSLMQIHWRDYKVGVTFPVIALFVNVFAGLNIKKDNRLVNNDNLR
jgi:hypothetical protein